MEMPTYEFYGKISRCINSGVSRSVAVTGNVSDLFWNGTTYVPLIQFIRDKTNKTAYIQIVYEMNGPIKVSDSDRQTLSQSWIDWKLSLVSKESVVGTTEYVNLKKQFQDYMDAAMGNSYAAMEFLRQLCICSRANNKRLLIILGAVDILLPNGALATMTDHQVKRITCAQTWFQDPSFISGNDMVLLISESLSAIHDKISRLPQVVSVEVPAPSLNDRDAYIYNFIETEKLPKVWEEQGSLAEATAGLSLYALRQLLIGAKYSKQNLNYSSVTDKVEEFIKSQLGEDVVEFKKPSHRLKGVVGNTQLLKFINNELIPRIKKGGKGALTGCAVPGSIGSGKTFIFEGFAAELDWPILILKNIRSMWFGGTDVIAERLKRVISVLQNVVIEIDEADTQFGGLDSSTHETERRLTGKIQQMMSDPDLKGKVFWLLMTARIHLLSADIRRPGRAGDLIIPVFDPEGEDLLKFMKWTLSAIDKQEDESFLAMIKESLPLGYSAAAFSALKSFLEAMATPADNIDVVKALILDLLPADIGLTREYQKLQALVNCTRRCLLPALNRPYSIEREGWQTRIGELEKMGIK